MSDIPIRNRPLRQLSFACMLVGILAAAILAAAGMYILMPTGQTTQQPSVILGGMILILGGFMLGVIPMMSHVLLLVLLKAEGNVNRIHHSSLDMAEIAKSLEPLIREITENSRISDAAKSIAHREPEREALRQAIREEMYSGDWEAAHYLIEDMERRFGYMQEAKTLRAEVAQVRDMTIEEKIGDVIAHIEKLMLDHRWDRARQESERLLKLFPRHERVMRLPAELSQRREAHKQDLLARWAAAVQRNEIDNGIAILTELDEYLTREEAQMLRDSARHVFKARLLNLGVQFGLAVQEQRWRDALEIGLQLRHEFPNSRMAQEVAEKLDVLRVRAGFVSDAEVIQKRVGAAAT